MHDKFTERVRKVMYLAREEAARLQHDYIGTEHLLLGLIREGEGIAANVLSNLGLDLDVIRQAVESMVASPGGTLTIGEIPFTPKAKRVLELSIDEARQLGHNYIGTEHILLGLIREGEGVAAQVLGKLGADLNKVRQQVIQLLSGYQGKEPATSGGPQEGTPSGSLVLDQFGLLGGSVKPMARINNVSHVVPDNRQSVFHLGGADIEHSRWRRLVFPVRLVVHLVTDERFARFDDVAVRLEESIGV